MQRHLEILCHMNMSCVHEPTYKTISPTLQCHTKFSKTPLELYSMDQAQKICSSKLNRTDSTASMSRRVVWIESSFPTM
jgi:hypothetical protein